MIWRTADNSVELRCGDCLEVMRGMESASVDAIVTDPPYGLSFMGKRWDYDVPGVDVWMECFRVLKPGGHLLAFAGTRTQHRMAVNIEDAGFEIRDMIAWVYGSGFPKSLDVSKAIDKAAGYFTKRGCGETVDRNALDYGGATGKAKNGLTDQYGQNEPPATDAARQWQGWGTALKPALEPITVARKPLIGTVAENVLEFGTGGINVDWCRVQFTDEADKAAAAATGSQRFCKDQNSGRNVYGQFNNGESSLAPYLAKMDAGRWPANLIHDGSEDVVSLFPHTTSGKQSAGGHVRNSDKTRNAYGTFKCQRCEGDVLYGDSGSASRFFYAAKVSRKERNGSKHPTVKPLALMEYLVRLVTPPAGLVLDPFLGSGTTAVACYKQGFRFIGIELEPEYFNDAIARVMADSEQFMFLERKEACS